MNTLLNKNYLILLAMLLLAVFNVSCSSSDEDDYFSPDDLPENVSEKPDVPMKLGTPEMVVVNEDNCVVSVAGCTIELNPSIVDGNTNLSVTKATQVPWILNKDDQVTAYDVKVGDFKEFNGVAKIRIPVSFSSGKRLIAAKWNEKEDDWEPALCEYDKVKGEAVVWTDEPGTFGVMVTSGATLAKTRGEAVTFGAFIVERANTRGAGVCEKTFHYTEWEDPPILVINTLMSELVGSDNNLTKEGDLISQDILDTKAIYGDITYPVLKELGLSTSLMKNTADFMGKLAVAATFYQKLRAVYSGDVDKADAMTLKSVNDFLVGKAASLCKSSAMNMGMVAVAVFDYTLNKFAEEAWRGRKDLYKTAYELYYSEGHPGYRSQREWYDLFWPAFTKDGMTENRLTALIDAYVNKYCDKLWEDESEVAMELAEAGLVWTGGGGLSEGLKKDISAEYREYLYGDKDKLKKVFNAISEKLEKKQYDIMKDRMMKYAKHINGVVKLHFKDVAAKNGKSIYAGYTVKFKKMPISITDPHLWECKLDEKGEGDIQFRLFAYAAAGVKPDMVIVSPSGEEKAKIRLNDLNTGVNIIEFEGEEELDDDYVIKSFWFDGSVATTWYRYEDGRLIGTYTDDWSSLGPYQHNALDATKDFEWEFKHDSKWHFEGVGGDTDTPDNYVSFDMPGGWNAKSIKNFTFSCKREGESQFVRSFTIDEIPFMYKGSGNGATIIFETPEGESTTVSEYTYWSKRREYNTDYYNRYELRELKTGERNHIKVSIYINTP